MTDYFAVLGMPRRPGLDEAVLQENYLRLAAAWHPDAPGGDVEKFRDLQEARKTLLDPAARLRHLLALEGVSGSPRSGGQPPAEFFVTVATALDGAKSVSAKLQLVRSGIGRAACEAERADSIRKIATVLADVTGRQEACRRRIADLDAVWPERDLRALEEIRGEWVFLDRWERNLRETLFQLSTY